MGRRWIFTFEEPFDDALISTLGLECGTFFESWNSHGAHNESSWRIVQNQLLVVYVPDNETGPSGCSIDALGSFVKKISERFLNYLLDEHLVIYRNSDGFYTGVNRADFKIMCDKREINPDVYVVDNSEFNLPIDDFSNPAQMENYIFSGFIKKASDCWVKRYFE
ncbi:MAG TPA: hypothetical protein PKA63_03175 [Oligoflexia bacterium]|mgnify:CR=1 FL=1|nr:hypothetical protein [Oligoflexia bacterium]HMP47657.1 hypothetical protein [Oligoflexia bacterium]